MKNQLKVSLCHCTTNWSLYLHNLRHNTQIEPPFQHEFEYSEATQKLLLEELKYQQNFQLTNAVLLELSLTIIVMLCHIANYTLISLLKSASKPQVVDKYYKLKML